MAFSLYFRSSQSGQLSPFLPVRLMSGQCYSSTPLHVVYIYTYTARVLGSSFYQVVPLCIHDVTRGINSVSSQSYCQYGRCMHTAIKHRFPLPIHFLLLSEVTDSMCDMCLCHSVEFTPFTRPYLSIILRQAPCSRA